MGERTIEEVLGGPSPDMGRSIEDVLSVQTTPSQDVAAAQHAMRSSPPVTPEEQAAGRQFYTRTLPRAAASAIPAIAATTLTGGMAAPLAMLTEGGAAGLGDLAYQGANKAVRGEPIKPMESLEVGGTQALGTGVARGAWDVLSRLGKVAPQFTRYFRNVLNTGRYTRTMAEPAKDAEFALGEQIKSAVDELNSRKTAPRIAKEKILQEATDAGEKIHAGPIIAALEDAKLAAAKTPVGEKLNADLSKIQRSFMRVKKGVADLQGGQMVGKVSATPRADLTPKEVDEFLTKEIDNRIYKASGSPKNQALAEALSKARGAIRQHLLDSLPDEAATQTKKIYEELTAREGATKAIQPGMVSLETKIRNIFKPGHEGERQALEFIGKKMGVDFHGAAFKLAQQRAFSPDERLAAKGLDALMELISGGVARPALKILAPLQPVINAAPAAAAGAYMSGPPTAGSPARPPSEYDSIYNPRPPQ